MAGPNVKRRATSGKLQRPSKKQKRAQAYHSDTESEQEGFDPVNLLDSDDDIHNAQVDEAAGSSNGESSAEEETSVLKKRMAFKMRKASKSSRKSPAEDDAEELDEGESDEDEDDSEDGDDDDQTQRKGQKSKSKRNDPEAFATSLSKILNTKLSTSKRSDPVLARSASAHEASKAAVDSALESKAKRQLKEKKRMAMEKGRVKDVLVASNNEATGEPETSTAEVLGTERRLRKVAQRGVVKLFNAVRVAQVRASEAEKDNRRDGVIGMKHREEKVNELSKKGFLELIASGGGGLKKGGLEEA